MRDRTIKDNTIPAAYSEGYELGFTDGERDFKIELLKMIELFNPQDELKKFPDHKAEIDDVWINGFNNCKRKTIEILNRK